MATNYGKKFEQKIKEACLRVPDTIVERLPDQQSGYFGSKNPCDFIVYHYPRLFYIECKSIHGDYFPLSNLTENQYQCLLERNNVECVIAGVIIWFINHDRTVFIPISDIKNLRENGTKSIKHTVDETVCKNYFEIEGKKNRVFFNYEMRKFLKVYRPVKWKFDCGGLKITQYE